MGWILDIALVAITLVTIAFYTFRGFIKSFLGSVKYVVALLIGYLLSKPIGSWISDNYMFEVIDSWLYSGFEKLLGQSGLQMNFEEFVDKLPNVLVSILNRVGFSWESIENSVLTQHNLAEVSKSIATPVSMFISSAMAFIIIFLLSVLLLTISIFFLDKFFKAKGLNRINKGLGFLFGCICAFVNLIVICSAITLILNVTSIIDLTASVEKIKEQTIIYRLISNINIFSWFW